MITYQDFEKESNVAEFISTAINNHINSDVYKTAKIADEYDHQRNITVNEYVRTIFSMTGSPIEDFTASNNKIASNFFHRLNTQRNMYSLGNGVSFSDHKEKRKNEDGMEVTVDTTNEFLGESFDIAIRNIGYYSLTHGVTFGFWNVDTLHHFPVTEFVPLWDEYNGSLRAGIRFWRLDKNKPMIAVLYEEDGYTKYRTTDVGIGKFELYQDKTPYQNIIRVSEADGEEVIGEDNYGSLPIVPMWGSKLRQSTIVGMRQAIDSYDLIRSGFANDLTDCSQIYWILENCGGMTDAELARFRDRLKINHIAAADTDNAKITPYSQDIPYSSRKEYLDMIRAGLYEDFGGLDVHTVAAGATNDHIDAAYQPLDEEADDFEYQVTEFIHQILKLNNIEDTPVFKRNRISNQSEQTQMVLSAAQYLDDETVLQKLPFISVDEVVGILAKRDMESESRFDLLDTEDVQEDQTPLDEA